ncbi:zincin [Periconia macrospinosa]|uniref:Metalloendopeptidase n=1 Tax=Periconia macrospinosa TaxID=97972 RepID=A0A2V1D7C9_9PLEO|nr:zincin [Periconia macrospinosa]
MASIAMMLSLFTSFFLLQLSDAQKSFTSGGIEESSILTSHIQSQTSPTSTIIEPVPSQSSTPSENRAVDIFGTGNYTVLDIYVSGGQEQSNGCNATASTYVRTVAYTVTPHGNAVIDGDIIVGTEADILNAAVHPSLRKRSSSIVSNAPQKWPRGVVLYNYQAGLDKKHIDYFQEGVKQWTDRLPFLKFEYSTDRNARTVVASDGNRSPYGCCGGMIELCPGCGNTRSARHEIGHTLGLYHEHQRPDRDLYMTLSCPGGKCNSVVIANTATFVGTGMNWAGSYDVNSLMHYSLSGSLPVGSKWYDFDFKLIPGLFYKGYAELPSRLDVQRVCELYYEDCHSICGDGIFSPGYGEECDDGNNDNGDGCSSSCKKEACVPTCHPSNHECGDKASCTTFDTSPNGLFPRTGQTFCMCEAGFRGTGLDRSGRDQYRVEWENRHGGQTHRVFVKPGQACRDVCSDIQCSEVPIKNTCR